MIGTSLGPYRLERELGAGGMGRVYLATIEGRVPGMPAGTRVALKVIHEHLLETPGFFKRFLREAEIGRSVRHENVVRTFDADAIRHDGRQINFLVMEYVEGQTLRSLLGELGRVPEELCRHIGREVGKGLAAIHAAGVVHRDLKPENVLITKSHEVKVMDLGVARLVDEALRMSQTGAFVGSVQYAAPEQFKGGGDSVDGRADLYALGLILYELATGVHPYIDEDFRVVMRRLLTETPRRISELNPQLSPFFEESVHTLLAKDPAARFQSAVAFLDAFEEGEKSEWWRARAKAIRIETNQPLRRIRIPRDTALYGRETELTKLRDLFARVEAGDGQALLVEGESGVGKSRLVDEFVGRLLQDGHDVNFLWGAYPPGGAATAAGAFSTAYREHFGDEGLDEALRARLTATPVLVPAFAALLRGAPPPKGEEPLTRESIQTVFVETTRSLAAERPTIVLIDDIHFAPEDGRGLFSAMAHAAPGHRVLFVATLCPGASSAWTANLDRLDQVSRMQLPRLSPKDVGRLLIDLFHSRRLAEELGFQILTKSDGNPFFVFEIVRGLREGKLIAQNAAGTWARTQVIQEIHIPSSVADLVEARLADVSQDDRNLLDVAACQGQEFDPLLVGDVLGVARIPLLQRLAHLEKSHRLVHSAGVRYVFDHHQIRESLYLGLSELLRREYHAAIGETLERRERAAHREPSSLPGGFAVDLARHFLLGGRGESARRYLDAALDHLDKGYLSDAVADLSGRALAEAGVLAGPDRLRVLMRRIACLDTLGRDEEETVALDEAVALAEATRDPNAIGLVYARLGDFHTGVPRDEDARRAYGRALAAAREAHDRSLEARIEGGLGSLERLSGRREEARRHHERHLALAREVGDRRAEASALASIGRLLVEVGRCSEARPHLEQALVIARETGAKSTELRATVTLAEVGRFEGRFDESLAALERCLEIERQLGNRRGDAVTAGNLGDNLWHLLRCAEALELMDHTLVVAREIGSRSIEGTALSNLGACRSTIGDLPGARARLAEALALFRATNQREWEAYALHELACVAEKAGDAAEAGRQAEDALAIRRGAGNDADIVETLVVLGRLSAADGRIDAARAAFNEALATSRALGQASTVVVAAGRLALLPGGDAVQAKSAYDEHRARVLPRFLPEAEYVLWRATGEREHLAEAWNWLRFLRDHAPEEAKRGVVENVPLHREIAAAWASQGAA